MSRRESTLDRAVTSEPAPVIDGTTRPLTILVNAAAFVCGAVLMGLEIVGSRILAPHFGSSIYDLVFLDAYFADALPFHLLTLEFFRELQTRLRPGGALVLNLIGALDGPGSRFYGSVTRTLRAAYPEVYTIPVTRPDLVDRLGLRSDQRRRNLILVAPRDRRAWSRAELVAAADRLIAAGRLPPEAKAFATGLLEGDPSLDGVPLLLDEHAPVDDLLHFLDVLTCRALPDTAAQSK